MDEFENQMEEVVLATITEVGANGVKIQIDGNDSANEKEYKGNTMLKLSVGDRVKVFKNSGTYLIEYKVGTPGEDSPLPAGGDTNSVLMKNSSSDYDFKWAKPSAEGLINGNYSATLNSSGNIEPSSSYSVSLGTSIKPFNNLYTKGTNLVGSTSSTLGFFGKTPVSRQTVANNASVATLITALKAYGLIV